MLRLNTDEIKNLQFEVVIQGINYDELTGALKFIIEDVEYGIPVKIQKDLVSVEVPPLEEIVAMGMKDGDVVECKLDIFGNGFYLNPWDGQFELKTPIKMETTQLKLDNDPKSKKKRMSASLKEEEESNSKLDKEAILEMLFDRLAEQGFSLNETPEPVYEEPEPVYEEPKPIKKAPVKRKVKPIVENKQPVKPKPRQPSRQELVERKIQGKFSGINGLIKKVNKLTESKKVIVNPKSTPKKKVAQIKESHQSTLAVDIMQKVQELKNRRNGSPSSNYSAANSNPQNIEQRVIIDQDDPIVLMESVGMKNPKIQQIMIDKAAELGGDGNKAISQTLKKLLGIEKPAGYDQYMNVNQKG